MEYEIIHTQFFAEIDSDGNKLIDELIQNLMIKLLGKVYMGEDACYLRKH